MRNPHEPSGDNSLPPLRATAAVALPALFAVALLIARIVVSQRMAYAFLLWNLFLAWVPLVLALMAESLRRHGAARLTLLAPLALWLLFLPNAPYILTDLVHLMHRHGAVFWYDLATVLAFAMAGLIAGIASMRLAHGTLASIAHPLIAHGAVATAAVLSGVGIYFGRVLRWNSWDLLTHPHVLLPQIGRAVLDPWPYRHAMAISLLFGGLFAVLYVVAMLAQNRNLHSEHLINRSSS